MEERELVLERIYLIRYDIYTTVEIAVGYSDFQKLTPLFGQFGFRTDDTIYEDSVRIVGSLLKSSYDAFTATVTEATSGRASVKLIEEKFDC